MSPIIHIVNVGSESTESYANINVCTMLIFMTDCTCHLMTMELTLLEYFSVKFSIDGHELVAGSRNDSIYVYDLEENKLTLQIPAHSVWYSLSP
ncbi:putative transcription factor WD40-like family [Dioscorea sansibarensis]